LENTHNAIEAVRTNVLGTRVVMETARRCPSVRMFVFISTDKAVNPTSWMGATKRCAEKLVFGSAKNVPHMQHIIVRFGNVLGSSGSVVPLFRDQIARGGPVTITHEKMTRYLMTIPEAVSLVLQASVLGQQQEENFGLYVLDMGEPVLISDIAKRLMKSMGKTVPIEIIGVRPGEKLFEELFYDYESPLPSDVPGVTRASAFLTTTIVQRCLTDLIDMVDRRDYEAATRVLCQIVPEFHPENAHGEG
jgi:O-antigen biosynthesis protein WbqV